MSYYNIISVSVVVIVLNIPLLPLSQTTDVRDMCYCGLTNKSCVENQKLIVRSNQFLSVWENKEA